MWGGYVMHSAAQKNICLYDLRLPTSRGCLCRDKDTKNIRKMYNSHRLTQMAAKDTQGKTVFWRIAALLMLAAGIAAGWTLRGCGSGASGVMSPDTVTDTVRVADSVEVVVPITQRVYMKR